MDLIQDQRDFMLKFQKTMASKPSGYAAQMQMWKDLVDEEINKELMPKLEFLIQNRITLDEADTLEQMTEVLDGIIDGVYVLLGLGHCMGLPLAEAWKEVHASNMAKLGKNGQPIFREDGKVLKPDGWLKPDLRTILMRAITGFDQLTTYYEKQANSNVAKEVLGVSYTDRLAVFDRGDKSES